MSEIEDLYAKAGIYQKCRTINDCLDMSKCPNCHFNKVYAPPFTSKKQLELIKWLGVRDEFNFYQNKVTKDWIFYDHEKDATHYDFELGLASWVYYIWGDLTEEEKQQVKGILE